MNFDFSCAHIVMVDGSQIKELLLSISRQGCSIVGEVAAEQKAICSPWQEIFLSLNCRKM